MHSDADRFINSTVRDEQTGELILQDPQHKLWHAALNTYDRVAIWANRGAGLTTQITIGRVLYEIAQTPDIRIVVVSRSVSEAQRTNRTLQRYLKETSRLSHLQPETSSNVSFTVPRCRVAADPTVQCVRAGENLLGSRADLIVFDSICDYENTRSDLSRQEMWNWVQTSALTRLTKGSRAWMFGGYWHEWDVMHRFAKTPGVATFRTPVLPSERWPEKHISKCYRDLGPSEARRQLYCVE